MLFFKLQFWFGFPGTPASAAEPEGWGDGDGYSEQEHRDQVGVWVGVGVGLKDILMFYCIMFILKVFVVDGEIILV